MIDEKLRAWATPRQSQIIDAIAAHGSGGKAAKALGVNKSTINKAMQALQARATKQGYSPSHGMTRPVADGYIASRISTNYKEDGTIGQQWVVATPDKERQEQLMRAGLDAMAEALPRQAPVAAPRKTISALANLYTLTDSHVGMLAWDKENLDQDGNWDLEIAERVLTGCFEAMVNASPAAETGIVAQLGDFLHSDGLKAVTPTSGHVLDQDGRFPKVVQAAIRTLRRVINFALAKHKKVVVLLAEGNHDLASSVWLRAMFKALYENESRVEVIDSELPYYVHQHGETMLGWHHGHLKKNEQLPLLFAAQFPRIWGATTKRYAHTGHRHHVEEKEHSGMKVVQHSTVASRDSHASRGGWHSERQSMAITYHTKFGEVARNIVTPAMLLQ